jgi:gamma-glutamyltranspeptidase/glutathione hydrolase
MIKFIQKIASNIIAYYGSPQPTGDTGNRKGDVYLESGYDYQVIRELMEMGHSIGFGIQNYGGYQAIMYDSENGVYIGASESRKDGQSAGY